MANRFWLQSSGAFKKLRNTDDLKLWLWLTYLWLYALFLFFLYLGVGLFNNTRPYSRKCNYASVFLPVFSAEHTKKHTSKTSCLQNFQTALPGSAVKPAKGDIFTQRWQWFTVHR
jgi:hypothetical protein